MYYFQSYWRATIPPKKSALAINNQNPTTTGYPDPNTSPSLMRQHGPNLATAGRQGSAHGSIGSNHAGAVVGGNGGVVTSTGVVGGSAVIGGQVSGPGSNRDVAGAPGSHMGSSVVQGSGGAGMSLHGSNHGHIGGGSHHGVGSVHGSNMQASHHSAAASVHGGSNHGGGMTPSGGGFGRRGDDYPSDQNHGGTRRHAGGGMDEYGMRRPHDDPYVERG